MATSPQIEYLVLACEEGAFWPRPTSATAQLRADQSRLDTPAPSPPRRPRIYEAVVGILSIGAQTVAADCILGRDSPVPTPTTVLPLASVLPLLDVGTEPSRMM